MRSSSEGEVRYSSESTTVREATPTLRHLRFECCQTLYSETNSTYIQIEDGPSIQQAKETTITALGYGCKAKG